MDKTDKRAIVQTYIYTYIYFRVSHENMTHSVNNSINCVDKAFVQLTQGRQTNQEACQLFEYTTHSMNDMRKDG